jgi:hypothetical protein
LAGGSTWTLNESVANSYTGGTTAANGTLILDYSNLTTPTNLVTGALTLSGGNLKLVGKATGTGTTSQTFSTTTIAANAGSTLTLAPGGSNSMAVNLGAVTHSSSYGTLVINGLTGTSTAAITGGISNGTGTFLDYVYVNNTDFATLSGSNIVAFSSYVALPSSGGTNTFVYQTATTGTITASETAAGP